MADVKQKPVVVRTYEELQEKSIAMLVNVEPDPSTKEIEDVRDSIYIKPSCPWTKNCHQISKTILWVQLRFAVFHLTVLPCKTCSGPYGLGWEDQ